ncbi:calcium-binding protein [Microcoleus sp. w2-18bC1]|uniref:calcium-binding protein n=1 Tax=unclassified Microcoleus TaxID=2642155 RepID=UPI002FD4EDF1
MMNNTYSVGKNILVKANSMVEQNLLLTLEQAVLRAQEQLQVFASDSELGQKIELAFGSGVNAEELRKAWQAGDFSQLPHIEIRSAKEINGANGAFAKATNTVYLSQEYLSQNVGNSEAVTRVLLEEIGHFVDSKINITDTPGDEGQIFSAIVSNQNLTPDQLQVIRGENDSTFINLDGQVIQVEQSVPNQILWSQRIGKSIEDTFSIGSLVGLPNAKTWTTKDIFQKPLQSLGLGNLIKNDVLGLDTAFGPISIPELKTPNISLGGVVSASANAKFTIAGPNNSSQPANIKAGLQVDAGYNLGEVKWNLPLFTDVSLNVTNGYLDFQSKFDKRGAFFDYISPYFYLGIKGIFESKAAAYITGGASLEYVDIIESLFSWEKKTNTKSVSFNEKIPLSAKLTHQFVDFDTRKNQQTIDWIASRKTYNFTESGIKSDPLPLGKYLNFGFNLPNLNNIDFKSDLTADGYKFSASAKAKDLISFDLKLDDIIADKLPIPTSIADSQEYEIFGKTFGYNYDLSLFDASLKVALDADFKVDFTISDLQPKLFIDGVALDDLKGNINFNLPATDPAIVALDKNKNGKLDIKLKFDPLLTANVNSFLTPTINLKTGIGKVAFNLKPFNIGFDKLLLPISNSEKSLGKFDLLSAPLFSKRFSQLDDLIAPKINLASLLEYDSQIDIDSLRTAIDPKTKFYLGTPNPDYLAGTNLNDKPKTPDNPNTPEGLQEDSDVAQLSPGKDDLDGGPESSPIPVEPFSYQDAFGKDILTKRIPNGDIFILDSDIYSLTKGDVRLFADIDAKGRFFELDLDGKSGITNGPDTQLRDFERLILSDELKASSQGIKLNLASLSDFGNSKPRLYVGGLPNRKAYSPAAPLSTHHLTTTKGSDYLTVPVGYNDVPYILGKGDDVVDFSPNVSTLRAGEYSLDPLSYISGTSPNNSLNTDWKNPYDPSTNLRAFVGNTRSFYQDVIDLGGGNNTVSLTNISNLEYPYNVFINSVNVGGTNNIKGDLSKTSHALVLVNFGGSSNISLTHSGFGRTNQINGILSGGGNNISFTPPNPTGNDALRESSLTFVLDSEGLQQKFRVSEIQEVEVELSGSKIVYRTANPSSDSPLTLTDNLDPDTRLNTLRIASADIAGSSIQKELGSDVRYSLQSPAKQTYIVGKVSPPPDTSGGGGIYQTINLRGRLDSQKGSYRKVVLKNELNNAVSLDDLVDEVVIEGASALKFFDSGNSRANYGKLDLRQVDFNSLTNPSAASDFTSRSYVHEIVYSDNADRISNSTANSYSPSVLTGSFLNSPFAKYAPLVTHRLGSGDDLISDGLAQSPGLISSTNTSKYEFFYLGSGNNTVVNHDFLNTIPLYSSVNLVAYQPGTGIEDLTGGEDLGGVVSAYSYQVTDSNSSLPIPRAPFGDVVVYTEGSRSDYVIQRSQTQPNAIEVIKKDGTKDTLFGVSLIKFETEDVSLIPVPNSITSPAEVTRIDIFGNDLKSRLFYSHVVRPDGESFDIQLDNKWAVDRVDVTQQEIRQPGAVPTSGNYEIPVGLTEFNLTKALLLKEFKDPDISVKNLYTLNDLTIGDLKVTQKVVQGTETIDVIIPVETLDDRWLIKSTNPITLDSFPFEISYIITEPEGYSHLVRLNLNPSEVISLQDLRTIFQAGISNNEFNGSNGNDNIDGSDQAETIRGNGGQNIIYGGASDDRLFGGDDSDFISGDPGSDTIEGGSGDDIIDGDSALAQNMAPALGTETSTSTSVSANDVINGGFGDDIILGGIGDDRLIPGKGNDLIEGGEGTDTGVSSGTSTDYRLRKRLDASILLIDERTTDNEGIELYRDTEKFEFSDRTFTIDEVPTSSVGAAAFNEDQTQVTIQTSEQNLELRTVEGSKIVSIDIPSLEDLIVDKVLLAKSLAVLEKYRNTKGEKFNASSSVLEFLVQTPDTSSKEVIEFKLAQEQDANTFIKIKPSTGETFEFNYNPATGTGAELIDSNGNGLVDLVKIHLKDGDVGDADGEINGVIYDPGMLGKTASNSGSTGNPLPTAPTLEPIPESAPALEETNTLIGTNSDDLIIGRQGDEVLIGKLGNDSLFGGLGNDLLYGNQGEDILNGNHGNDTVYGAEGNDIVRGGKNNDLILGNLGDDNLFGNPGNDTLIGGQGNDSLMGGAGNDLFVLDPATGVDAIADFRVGQDRLELSGGLRFEQLDIAQGTGISSRDTFVRIAANQELLTVLSYVPAISLTDAAFTFVGT